MLYQMWCTGGRAASQLSRGFRGISSPEGLRYSTVPLTAAPSCVGRSCRSRGTQQTGGFRDREASVRRRAAARRGWQRERRWGAAPHPGLSGELLRELPDANYPQTGLFLKKCLCFSSLYEGFAIETAGQIPMWDQCEKVGMNIYIYIYIYNS